MTYLIDTNILIDHLRGESAATEFLVHLEESGAQASVSVLTEYELLATPHLSSHQATEIGRLLSIMPRLAVTSRVARTAAEFRRRWQINVVDALIAATAHLRRAMLVTRNLKDFKAIKGLRLRCP